MKAYEVILKCIEEDDPNPGNTDVVKLITIAKSIKDACDYVVKAYTKADETTEGFHWEVVTVMQLDANLCVPATKEIAPKT